MHIAHDPDGVRQGRQFMIVRAEECLGMNACGDVFDHRLCQGHAVIGGRAASDLIKQNQRGRSRILQGMICLGHLHHEGGLTRKNVITCADPRKDLVKDRHAHCLCGHIASHLGKNHDQRGLPHVGGFTAHIRTGDKQDGFLLIHIQTVGDIAAVLHPFRKDRMLSLFDDEFIIRKLRPHIAIGRADLRKGRVAVQFRQRNRKALKSGKLTADLGKQFCEELLFNADRIFLRMQDLVFLLLQFRGDEAFIVYQCLPAHIAPLFLHLCRCGLGNINIVAEYLVVSDAQILDSGTLAFLCLKVEDKLPSVALNTARLIKCFVIAVTECAAVRQRCRWIIHKCPVQQFPQGAHGVQ